MVASDSEKCGLDGGGITMELNRRFKPALETETFEASTDAFADSTLFEGNICGPIASSMDESMFKLVISKWQDAFEAVKKTNNYKFLSAAGSLMKNMIRMLDLVLKSLPEDSKEPQTARILLYKLVYDQTDQGVTQFLLNLIKMLDTHKQPKSDLADLVEMIYVLVRLMENLQARGTLRVSKKSRKGRKKRNVKGTKETENDLSGATIQNENCISNDGDLANSCMTQKESLIDATSDGKEDKDITSKVDEPEMAVQETGNPGVSLLQMDNRKSGHADDDYCSIGDSSGDEQPTATIEVDFKVSNFLSAFANSSVIQKLCWLLKFYKSNSNRTNHYVICMLRRVTDDLELSPMLYQVSLITIFYDILAEQKSCPSKEYVNIVDFLTRLVRKMLKRMKNQPLLFVEILSWKTRRDCHYINAEYLLHELGNAKKQSATWGNVSETGDIGSSHVNGWARRSIADALGEDEADVVISHELGYQKSRENFVELQEGITYVSNSEIDGKENSDHGMTSMHEESEKVSERKRRLVLSEEWDTKIKDLYEKFKDDRNCSRLIVESLDPEGKVSAAQVSNKLKQLGFKVAPKKRVRYPVETSTAGPDQHGEDRCVMETKSALHNSNDLEESSLRQPLNTRKRVHAFDSDQEAKIKVLFEQFKDHKRCSYMIANALDAGNKFTAAQVSRKLKQLGLCGSRLKRSKADMHLRDAELNDCATNKAHDSDQETLLSFRKRSKRGVKLFPERGGKLLHEESQEKNMQGILSDDSDDETLSSVLKNSRKLLTKPKGNKLETETDGEEETNDHKRTVINNNIMERNGRDQSSEMDIARTNEGISVDNVSLEGTSETKVIGVQTLVVSPVNNEDDLEYQLMDDDLEDLGGDVAADELTRSSLSRRKLRMVIDAEDDD